MPPRFAAWLLALTARAPEREDLLGDLAEEHAQIAARLGRPRANAWYRNQVRRSLIPNLLRRVPAAGDTLPPSPRSSMMIDMLDVRYAARVLWRSPAFTIPAVLTLALGIGAATSVFTVVQRVLLQPLPYAAPDQLVRLWDRNDEAGLSRFSVSPANYFAWRSRSSSLQNMGAYREDGLTVAIDGTSERVDAARVTASLLDVLRVTPAAGRNFSPADDRPGAAPVVILSHAMAARLGGAQAIAGRALSVDGRPHEVVGVLPRGFVFPQVDNVQLFVPYALNEAAPEGASHFLRVLGRLTDGGALEAARAEMTTIAANLATATPNLNDGWTVHIESLHEATVGDAGKALMLLFGAAGLLLLMTCANVAGLLLARGAAREQELALRSALGAGRARLARQLFTENLVLTAVGAALGLAAGQMTLDLLLAVNPDALPRSSEIAMDWRIVSFTAALSLVTSAFFGIAPWMSRSSRRSLSGSLVGSGRVIGAGTAGRRFLVAGEIALAVTLVAAAAMLVQNLTRLGRVDPGFDVDRVLTMELRPPAGRYDAPPSRVRLFESIIEALEAVPGAAVAGGAHRLPLSGNSAFPLLIDGKPLAKGTTPPSLNFRAVAGRYFEALGAGFVRGRDFTSDEMWRTGGAVVINEAAAARYFEGVDPLTARLIDPRTRAAMPIIGIVENMRESDLDEPAEPALYFPYAVMPSPAMTLVLRGPGDPVVLALPARQVLQQIDATLAPSRVRSMDAYLSEVLAEPRFQTLLLTTFAVIALVLAAVGTYGVIAFGVAQRTSEIGVRMALGATPADVFRTIVMPGMALAAAGTLAGLAGATGLAWMFEGMLFGLDARQPLLLGGTALLLFAVAAVATSLPARRAMRIDPISALRAK